MNNSIFNYDMPDNEPVLSYSPGSKERKQLIGELEKMSSEVTEIPLIIGGKEYKTGNTGKIVMPHNNKHLLAIYHQAGEKEVEMAIEAAMGAHKEWQQFSWFERSSISLKIAELISKKYRAKLNAATMLGQSKNAYQAEIDSACETIDFLRFNAYYISQIYHEQPISDPGIINRIEYRPLEGFVLAISPFNFTAIASNLNFAPALMGNTIVWKPSTNSLISNYLLMKIYQEAGLPDGVINFIPGPGSITGKIALKHKDLGGVHFTGSTSSFNQIWKTISENLENYKSYPRIVGETGGKDFIFMHESADIDQVTTAMVRGAFEYQGQKCSAASRAYIPQSKWDQVRKKMADMIGQITAGDVADFTNFMNAVIDEKAFDRIIGYIQKARESDKAEVIFGGNGNKENGYFIDPTVILVKEPHYITMEEEIFGPVLSVYIYPDEKFEETLEICNNTSPYALTGSFFSKDRTAIRKSDEILKYAAGNFYINDKPTGAVVGQQPFGGSRHSGTNDKSGSYLNLVRWTNPRTIKETLLPPDNFKYPFMKEGHCGDKKV